MGSGGWGAGGGGGVPRRGWGVGGRSKKGDVGSRALKIGGPVFHHGFPLGCRVNRGDKRALKTAKDGFGLKNQRFGRGFPKRESHRKWVVSVLFLFEYQPKKGHPN